MTAGHPTHRTGARMDARDNYARLLEAAVQVLAERGAGAEMHLIADRAGVGVGTLYRHFPSKGDLILAVMEVALAAFEHALDDALTEDDPLAAVRILLRDGIAISARYGRLFASDLLECASGASAAADLFRRGSAMERRLLAFVEAAVGAGRLRPDLDPCIVVAALAGAFTSSFLARCNASGRTGAVAAQVAELVLHGASLGQVPPVTTQYGR